MIILSDGKARCGGSLDLGGAHIQPWKASHEQLRKRLYDGVFRCKMACLDQIQSHLSPVDPLVVADLPGHDSVTAVCRSVIYNVAAGASAHSDLAHRAKGI